LTRVSCERLSCTAVASISSLFGRVSDSYRSCARFELAAGLFSLPSGGRRAPEACSDRAPSSRRRRQQQGFRGPQARVAWVDPPDHRSSRSHAIRDVTRQPVVPLAIFRVYTVTVPTKYRSRRSAPDRGWRRSGADTRGRTHEKQQPWIRECWLDRSRER